MLPLERLMISIVTSLRWTCAVSADCLAILDGMS